MDTDTVFFVPWDISGNMLERSKELYKRAGTFDVVSPGDKVAIKLHAGELGNPNYVRPFFLKHIVDQVRSLGGKPFLTDTTTYYPLQRNNAVDHMETAVANGFGFAPFIVADGLRSENGISQPSPDPLLSDVEVAGAVHQADAMIVVSHLKGHPLTGFGGAIKNVGMGCVTKKTKLEQHRLLDLVVHEDYCQGCGTCVEACWLDVPRIESDVMVIDSPYCMRCPICSSVCPEGAITLENRDRILHGLSVAAKGVMDTFPPGKVSYVNFANDVSTVCDCAAAQGDKYIKDVGIFASHSPLSIDALGLEHIDYGHLNRLHGVDCTEQLAKMAELGTAGSRSPALEKV
ncbi:MAG: DUF362 domain-containing protein [Desulfohalobiaceae bacterium]|nr:DUF362 domain-containing protein [Desulfohalobiaceae bacterium]